MSTTVLAAIATLVAAAFTVALADRWWAHRRPHEAAWALAMGQFTVASLALWAGGAAGWNRFVFRVFYLFGAITNVAWLALGSVLLLNGGRRARAAIGALALTTAYIAGVMTYAPLQQPIAGRELPEGREVFGVFPRVLAAVGSGLPATVIIVLALWSAVRLTRGSRVATGSVPAGRLAFGNLVIAIGTLVLGASGTLAGRFGKAEAFAVTLALGVVVLFAGFLITTGTPGTRMRTSRQLALDLLTAD
jgi:hypothetical protein